MNTSSYRASPDCSEVERLNRDGESLYASGRLDEAHERFDAAYRLDAGNADTLNNLGVSCLARNRPREALNWFRLGLIQAPAHRELALNSGVLLRTLEQEADAGPAHRIAAEKPAWPPLPSRPLVSVVIPTRDRPGLLACALQSLVDQSYDHWEALVVNDGGADPRESLSLRDSRIRFFRHRFCMRQAAARNTALRMAAGEIVCYLDDDDTYLPHHLSTIVDALRSGEAGFVYTDAVQIQEVSGSSRREALYTSELYPHGQFSRDRLLINNYIPINTWAHRFECIRQCGFFDETLNALEDWEFLLRVSADVPLVHLESLTVQVHARMDLEDNVSRREARQMVTIFERLYARYPVGDASLETSRQAALEQLRLRRRSDELSRRDADPALLYEHWCDKHGLTETDARFMALRMETRWTRRPEFELVTHDDAADDAPLQFTWASLENQLYKRWTWCILSDRPRPPWTQPAGDRIHWAQPKNNTHIKAPAPAGESPAEWLGWIEAGDQLAPHALFKCAEYADLHPRWQLIYTDEDVIDGDGRRCSPSFKPDINLDLIRGCPYLGSLMLVRRDAMRAVGNGSGGPAAGYDLALHMLDRFGPPALGHVPAVLYHRNHLTPAPPENEADLEGALLAHLARNGESARVLPGYAAGTCFVEYDHAGAAPLVSIIIPTRNALEVLQPCLDSVLEKTTYSNFEVIVVDNGSDDRDALTYLEDVQKRDRRVRVIEYPRPFNFSAMINLAADRARGEYLLLLNNDTQIVQANWLDRLLDHGLRPKVGVVGPRMVSPDRRIQHMGIWLGMYDVGDHMFMGLAMDEPGPMNRAHCAQNVSAVSGACLLVRTSVFQQAGGLDADALPVLFNEVDLCLKIHDLGYTIVCTPFSTLVHRGAHSTRKRGAEERRRWMCEARQVMWARWLPRLANDPAGNRNISLTAPDARVETRVDVNWDPRVATHPCVLAFPFNRWGTGFYRVRSPLKALEEAGMIQHSLMPNHEAGRIPGVCEVLRANPDTLLMQNLLHDRHLEYIESYRRHGRAFLVFGQDDLLVRIPVENPYSKTVYRDVETRLRRALASCDRLVVSTQPLAEELRDMVADVIVVPNRLPRSLWTGLESSRQTGARPRVGWAGAQQHAGDLAVIIDVVKRTEKEVDWVFFGMCPDEIRPYCREFHPGVALSRYPETLAGLNLDLAVAPLADNRFNACKSNLRILEYGILGWPVVATDIEPFRDAPLTRVANNTDAWVRAIRDHVNDPDASARAGQRLRAWVLDDWLLENHLDEWMRALFPGVKVVTGSQRESIQPQ